MRTTAFKIKIFPFPMLFILFFVCFVEASAQDSIQIPLVYPQASNAPKRQAKRIDEPAIVKGRVFIDITGIKARKLKRLELYQAKRIDEPAIVKGKVFIDTGIKAKQLEDPEPYVEYFLDNDLIYSTEDKKLASLGFILDTRRYKDGKHTLVVNLWDKDGPSAIGMREIIIQNQTPERK